MGIAGIWKGGNVYSPPSKPVEIEKVEDTRLTQLSRTDTVRVSKTDGRAYYAALCQKFGCVKSGSVSISGAYLDKCANDPDKAAELEENLAVYNDCVQRGYQNAKMSAQAAGGELVSFSETWSIDGKGNIMMISCGTVKDDTGSKSWKEITKETLKRLKSRWEKAIFGMKEEKSEETSKKQSGSVAVNEVKRARQIAAAKSRGQVQRLIALLRKDMADCKAGMEQGMCNEAEIAKVEALLSQAEARLGQVPQEDEDDLGGLDQFDLASLM